MASYLDNTPPKFTPYVQQMPVETMVAVGMQKQKQYEENVTKIQGQIDNIAGLDVYKDTDKQYLQSKLNQLGNDLTSVAGGDFSNFQLVNSVSGMTGQIVKDKNVQNAVSSTAWLRKQRGLIDEAKKAGKSNIANEDLFNFSVSSWANDGKVGSAFNSEYIQYTDVFKELQEIGKSVGVDASTVQKLFETDKNNNYVTKNGKLQLNDVMAEAYLKGKDKDKLLNAFTTGLSSDAKRQLGITGRYNLKGVDVKELHGMLDEGFLDYQKNSLIKKDLIQDKILELKGSKGDQEMIDALEKQVVTIDQNIEKRQSSLAQMKSSDPDVLRGSIYSNNYLDGIANSMTEKEAYTKYLKNPAVEMSFQRQQIELAEKSRLLEADKFRYQQRHDREVMSEARWKTLFDAGLVDEKGRPTGANQYSSGERDAPLTDINNGVYFQDQFVKGLENDTKAQWDLYEKLAVASWTAKNADKGLTQSQIKTALKQYADKTGHTYHDYIVIQGQKAVDISNSSKQRYLGAEYDADIAGIKSLNKTIGRNTEMMKDEKNAIIQYAKDNNFTPVDLEKVDIKPMTITAVIGGEGRGDMKTQQVTLNKQDVIDFATIMHHNESEFTGGAFDNAILKKSSEEATNRQKAKLGMSGYISIYNQLASHTGTKNLNLAAGVATIPGFALGTSIYNLAKPTTEVDKAINIISNSAYKKTIEAKEQYYKGISQISGPKQIILYKDKPEQQKHLSSALTAIASDYTGIDNKYQELAALATDPKSEFRTTIIPAAGKYGKNGYSIDVTKPDGSVSSFPIEESQYTSLTNKSAPETIIDEISGSIKASRYGSTNLAHSYTDKNAYSTAFVTDAETNTKNYNVAIDYVKGMGGLMPKIYVQTGEDWKVVSYDQPLTPLQAQSFPYTVDDVLIKSLLNK